MARQGMTGFGDTEPDGPGSRPGPDGSGVHPDETCPQCGGSLQTRRPNRGLNHGLHPGREVLEQTCDGCGLLRVRVRPTQGGGDG